MTERVRGDPHAALRCVPCGQFGVLLNGSGAYPYAANALAELRDAAIGTFVEFWQALG